jgi:rubrerythrin
MTDFNLKLKRRNIMAREKRWQCLVCGYIHVGPVPPKYCPPCGADQSRFILYK